MTQTRLPLSHLGLHQLYKQADPLADAQKVRAMRAVLGATALGFGGGAAVRGLLGLKITVMGGMPLEDNPGQTRMLEVPVVRQKAQDAADTERLAPRLEMARAPQPPRLLPRPMKYAAAVRPLEHLAAALAKQAGVGSSVRGALRGLTSTARSTTGGASAPPTGPAPATMAAPPAPAAPTAAPPAPAGPGLAAQLGGAFNNTLTSALGSLAPHMPSTTGASNPAASAAYLPMVVGGGVAGAGGGWALVDWLLERHRKAEMAKQLDSAKSDYRRALDEQYAAMLPPKQASEGTLDDVAAAWEKRGWPSWMPSINIKGFPGYQPAVDTGNALGGAYLTAAGLTALGSGVASYEWTKSRGQAAALEAALRRRRLERAGRPAPVMAVAKEVEPDEFEES
jgi:hypothetical protein